MTALHLSNIIHEPIYEPNQSIDWSNGDNVNENGQGQMCDESQNQKTNP